MVKQKLKNEKKKLTREEQVALIGVRNLMENCPELNRRELLKIYYSPGKPCPAWAIDMVCKEKGIKPGEWGVYDDYKKDQYNKFIWDGKKVLKRKFFSLDIENGKLFFGMLLPKEVDNIIKGKVIGKMQRSTPVLITNGNALIEWNLRAEENLNISFQNIPSYLPNRWRLEDIKKYLDGRSFKINGKELLDKIVKQYKYYLFIRNNTWYKVHALWDIGTYFYQIFSTYPFIELRGLAGTGKTKAMTISSFITFNGGEIMINPSEATLFREKDEIRGCTYFDEAEKLWIFNKITKQWEGDIRTELINASHSKQGHVPRQEKIGNRFITRWYSPYGPTMLGSISGLHGATETRAITRITTKSTDKDARGETEPEDDREQVVWWEIRDMCYRLALTHWKEIRDIYSNFPKDISLKRRDLQLWKPLLSIAKFIDGDLFDEIVNFAQEHARQRLEDLLPDTSFDYCILNALRSCLMKEFRVKNNKLYVNNIKIELCMQTKNSHGLEDRYLNRNISSHLDKLGFKELRQKDRNGAFFYVTKKIFDETVGPICPDLTILSTSSSHSSQYNKYNNKYNNNGDDRVTIRDDNSGQNVTKVMINDESDDTIENGRCSKCGAKSAKFTQNNQEFYCKNCATKILEKSI